jgi:Spy/CpxP family protein refolding chaperone
MKDKDPAAAPAPAVSNRRMRRWTVIGLGVTALAAVGALGAQRHAQAHPMGFGGPGPGFGGWHGGMNDMDPAAMTRRIEAMVAFSLADIDASPEQRERITAIMKAAATDLQSSRTQHMQARRRSMELLAAPKIDRAQLEKLRAEQMQLGDAASRRMLQAMMDSAEVLAPEQRSKLAERWQRRMPPARG